MSIYDENSALMAVDTPDLDYLNSIGDTICGRRAVVLGSPTGPDAFYLWAPADFLDSDTVSNPLFTPVAGMDDYSYTVTVTSRDSACTITRTVDFTVLDADLDISANGSSVDTFEVCKGAGEVTFVATTSGDPDDIIWTSSRDTLNAATGASNMIDAELSTFVIATLAFDNGCVLSDTVFIRVDSLPEFEISVIPDPRDSCMKYCPGDVVTLVTNAPDLACFPDNEYIWIPSQDIVDSDTNLNVALQVSNANTQLYQRFTENHACRDTVMHLVEVVDTIPPLSGVPIKVCPGDEFVISIDTAYLPGFDNYTWMIMGMDATLDCDDCPNMPSVTVEVGPNATGSYSVIVMGRKEMCCDATGTIGFNITEINIPLRDTVICGDQPIQFFADPNLVEYEWTSSAGGSFDDPNSFDPTLSGIPTGGTFVQVMAKDVDGCNARGSAQVQFVPFEIPQVPALIVCPGDDAQLSVIGEYDEYFWTIGGGILSDPTAPNPVVSNISSNGAVLSLTVTDTITKCFTTLNNIDIDIFADDSLVVAPTVPDSLDYPEGTTVTVNANVTPQPATHIWFINGVLQNETGPSIDVLVAVGANEVCDSITNSSGCPEGNCVVLTGRPPSIFIPNVFAPGDMNEKNRRFQPTENTQDREPIAAEFIDDFQIWNRWGQKVYDNDSNATGWDGRQNGEAAPSDVYLYIIQITTADGVTSKMSGDVTLLR